jgi:hypothetical protein
VWRLHLLVAAISLVCLHRVILVLRQGYFTLPYGPPIIRAQAPLRFFAGVLFLAISFLVSAALFLRLIPHASSP